MSPNFVVKTLNCGYIGVASEARHVCSRGNEKYACGGNGGDGDRAGVVVVSDFVDDITRARN